MTQLEALCTKLGIRCHATYGGELPAGWPRDAHPYKVRLTFQGRQLTTRFYQGSAHTDEPSAADVLSCLASDARSGETSFDEFCSEFGYDSDSRKAEATWKACRAMAPRLARFLGEHREAIESAEH